MRDLAFVLALCGGVLLGVYVGVLGWAHAEYAAAQAENSALPMQNTGVEGDGRARNGDRRTQRSRSARSRVGPLKLFHMWQIDKETAKCVHHDGRLFFLRTWRAWECACYSLPDA